MREAALVPCVKTSKCEKVQLAVKHKRGVAVSLHLGDSLSRNRRPRKLFNKSSSVNIVLKP